MAGRYKGLADFLARAGKALGPRPVGLIFVEDEVEVESTIDHLDALGFGALVLFTPPGLKLSHASEERIHRVAYDTRAEGALPRAVSAVIAAAPGIWLHYCYNAEYLFFPFCESRSIGEMLDFHGEDGREAMPTHVVDLYAADLDRHPGGVSRDSALLDRAGYFARPRTDPATGRPLERQSDIFGGLRWRFEEHVPAHRRRIDRIGLFRARRGLRLLDGYLMSDPEMNTCAGDRGNTLTAAICSFRAAKALRTNPASRLEIADFRWPMSEEFRWESQQLMDLGLMEPGTWF
ncbi:hypothetical protein [Rhodovulum sulfidophilum]|uniref:Uncharacterized protein n=1 Tax=Rhodovulum sulfidophilum TaxID=35806 RepID=A0ABS1RS55_RHOSU|nr:hypothetical protein [Rhodovulum sulfidophilum]MBL3608727.1 hypothetical protein [Rhodovulum sulfidophilum]MCE8456542.1 hypothetical protein [Rhodovulum sulfidophilum]